MPPSVLPWGLKVGRLPSFANSKPDLTRRFWELGCRRIVLITSFFRGLRRKEVGGKEAA